MTCKDCICSEVCYYKAFNEQRNLEKRRNDVEKICKSFVHRDVVKEGEAVEVVHVHWLEHDDCCRRECPVCGFTVHDDACHDLYGDWKRAPKYCPECGAKMDGDGRG